MAFVNGNYTLTYKNHDFKVYFEMDPELNQALIPPVYGDEDNGIWETRKIRYNLTDLGIDIDLLEKGLACYDGVLNHDAIYYMLEFKFKNHAFYFDELTQFDKDVYFKIACEILRCLLESLGEFKKNYFMGYTTNISEEFFS